VAESKWADALAIFQDAIGSIVGRVVGFFVVCWGSLAVTGYVLGGGLLLPFAWFYFFVGGMAQGWGLLSYLALLLAMFMVHTRTETSVLYTLTVTALIQAFETWRFAMHNDDWEWRPRAAIFIACWTVFAGGFAFLVWREKASRGRGA
jgi:hypothetical protein